MPQHNWHQPTTNTAVNDTLSAPSHKSMHHLLLNTTPALLNTHLSIPIYLLPLTNTIISHLPLPSHSSLTHSSVHHTLHPTFCRKNFLRLSQPPPAVSFLRTPIPRTQSPTGPHTTSLARLTTPKAHPRLATRLQHLAASAPAHNNREPAATTPPATPTPAPATSSLPNDPHRKQHHITLTPRTSQQQPRATTHKPSEAASTHTLLQTNRTRQPTVISTTYSNTPNHTHNAHQHQRKHMHHQQTSKPEHTSRQEQFDPAHNTDSPTTHNTPAQRWTPYNNNILIHKVTP